MFLLRKKRRRCVANHGYQSKPFCISNDIVERCDICVKNATYSYYTHIVLCLMRAGLVKDLAYHIVKTYKLSTIESVLVINDESNVVLPPCTNARAIMYVARPAEETLYAISYMLHEYQNIEVLCLRNVYYPRDCQPFKIVRVFVLYMPKLIRFRLNVVADAENLDVYEFFRIMPEFAYYTFEIEGAETRNVVLGTKRIEIKRI